MDRSIFILGGGGCFSDDVGGGGGGNGAGKSSNDDNIGSSSLIGSLRDIIKWIINATISPRVFVVAMASVTLANIQLLNQASDTLTGRSLALITHIGRELR